MNCPGGPSKFQFTNVAIVNFFEQEEAGVGIIAAVSATRNDNKKYDFDFDIRRRLHSHPLEPPSTAIAGAGAEDPAAKFTVHTVKPDPCPSHKGSTEEYGAFATLTEMQMRAMLGDTPPKEGEYLEDDSP